MREAKLTDEQQEPDNRRSLGMLGAIVGFVLGLFGVAGIYAYLPMANSTLNERDEIVTGVVAFSVALLFAYIGGNLGEGKALKETLVNIVNGVSNLILGVLRFVLSLTILVGLITLAFYLYRHLPLWAFVLVSMLVINIVLLVAALVHVARSKRSDQ